MVGLALVAPAASAQDGATDPWTRLADLRRTLAGERQAASFVQTFVPANFSSGESENGTLALALPDCLRWDYSEPYPKSYLLCGDTFYAWSAEDRRGRRTSVDRQEEPGLDLLLLDGATLSERYVASVEDSAADATGSGGWTLVLRPREDRPMTAELARASFVVSGSPLRLVELSYEDTEGNTTRFEISDYRQLAADGAFRPPTDIEWEDL